MMVLLVRLYAGASTPRFDLPSPDASCRAESRRVILALRCLDTTRLAEPSREPRRQVTTRPETMMPPCLALPRRVPATTGLVVPCPAWPRPILGVSVTPPRGELASRCRTQPCRTRTRHARTSPAVSTPGVPSLPTEL